MGSQIYSTSAAYSTGLLLWDVFILYWMKIWDWNVFAPDGFLKSGHRGKCSNMLMCAQNWKKDWNKVKEGHNTVRFLFVSSAQKSSNLLPFRKTKSMCKKYRRGFNITLKNGLLHIFKKWTERVGINASRLMVVNSEKTMKFMTIKGNLFSV